MFNSTKICILDGYLDEPSCLGVPPYISPHVRYTYGALLAAGLSKEQLDYFTIDQLRGNREELLSKLRSAEIVVIVAGTTVPGKYLGGSPITLTEIEEIGGCLEEPVVFLSGPIINCNLQVKSIDKLAEEVPGLAVYKELTGEDPTVELEINEVVDSWARLGAELTVEHPNYPYLMCELETYRGCLREKHCSFCSEALKKATYQRSIEGIVKEVERLAELGNHYFRLGSQTDLLLYQALEEKDNLVPNFEAIKKLYTGIRKVVPDLKTLHMDNINPSTIADNPERSAKALKEIAKHNTAGDIAAFGLESADPQVLAANNIGTSPEKTFEAIKIMNQVSAYRQAGVPKLLPGLNFLHGLKGERPETLEYNFEFLQKVLTAGLMLRRINIRQVNPIQEYQAEYSYDKHQFKEYKQRINEEINQPMLKRVFPQGTILKEVIVEQIKGKLSYARQLGTYPILVGIPGQHDLGESLEVKVVDHGYRSLTALPWPFDINQASVAELKTLPGIGKSRAMRIFMAKKIENFAQLSQLLDHSYDIEQLEDLITFKEEEY
ncbi:radical SAM protein [Fuchsiella alkaliacetigena]|uniref:radical SAM protein n=1 Tax=Fuchsiella alkaliacetigena TaxID=957042 RepID=UPI00200A2DF4|nr:radical SAM protein [Fuchsiella alkaliacetigena]MCK8823760.1 radical SAM protein [Fuchsiella alkaliacetigena]